MKKTFLLILTSYLLPQVIWAAEGYTLLEPTAIGQTGATTVDLVHYLQYAFNTLIILSIIAAVTMIIYGGTLYILSGTPMGKGDGKQAITNALAGLILVLASWLILYTVNPDLIKLNFKISSPSSTSSVGTGTTGTTPTDGGTPNGTNPGDGGAPVGTTPDTNTNQSGNQVGRDPTMTEEHARQEMSDIGVDITGTPNSQGQRGQPCSQLGVGEAGCTSLAGIQQTTLDGVKGIHDTCPNCHLAITSGTDGAHGSEPYDHANGYKVDLQEDPGLTDYVHSQLNLLPQNQWIPVRGIARPTYVGNINGLSTRVIDETSDNHHYDVQFIKKWTV